MNDITFFKGFVTLIRLEVIHFPFRIDCKSFGGAYRIGGGGGIMQQVENGMTKPEIIKDLVHSWLHHIDHPNPKLKPCCSLMYVKSFQTFFEVVKGWSNQNSPGDLW